MASSDEEGEFIPDCVTDYHFVDHMDEVISFSELPLTWSDDHIPDCSNTQIFLRGSVDGGLQDIYKKVVSWKFELSYVVPEFYVLSKDKTWIRLQQPRKSFVNTMKTALITVHCLHFIKRNPGVSRDEIWNNLLKTFSYLEANPSENDLLVHKQLITEAINNDKDIAKSEYLTALLLDTHECTTLDKDNRSTKKSNFVVDSSDSDTDGDDGNESDEDIMFDSVCSFCDNGGDILCCEGRCMRSFHATKEAGVETSCVSLGFSDAQVEAMKTFLCKNCQYQRHQCFACGQLGSSNISSNTEVFPCVSATCGRFYHPKCVSKLLNPGDKLQADEVEKKIADGDSFLCPTHKCFKCQQGEDRKIHELQFALCRRCPKAYHRKCLPRSIAFEADEYTHQRAWDGLLSKRVLMYCMDHKMIPELGTPRRSHIVFPGGDGKQQQQHDKTQLLPVEKKEVARNYVTGRTVPERASLQLPFKSNKAEVTVSGGSFSKGAEKGFPVQGSNKRTVDVIMKSRKRSYMHPQVTVSRPSTAHKRHSYSSNDESEPSLRYKINLTGKTRNIIAGTPITKKVGTRKSLIEIETEARMMALIERSNAEFDEEEFIKKQKLLSGDSCSMSNKFEKNITLGKVEASVKAVEAALKKLQGGCTIEEAKAVCEPQVLRQIFRWKNDLSFYLAPFLHGMRYTSFGRHFTKVDKLKEIVDRLHWYVQEGDMIVDFCCGSNDFSCFLKEKLEEVGKSCRFKNYDLIQSKNDFNFEKRNWMTVGRDELPAGSQLIMGLNPPFGALGAGAYKFIKKALSFEPKLVILIVPRETKRLDAANSPYDLIWEDDRMLAGKSFYLPGSVDINDQQLEQWNKQAPPLYLWSRKDWTAIHKNIALKHGHINLNHGSHVERKRDEPTPFVEKKQIDEPAPYVERKQVEPTPYVERKQVEQTFSNNLMEETQDCLGNFSHGVNDFGDISQMLDGFLEDCGNTEHEGSRSSMLLADVQLPFAGLQYDPNYVSHSFYDPMTIQGEGPGEIGQFKAPVVRNLGFKECYGQMEGAPLPHKEEVQFPVADQNWNGHSYFDLKNAEGEGNGNNIGQIGEALVGNPGSLETGELCIDMELDTPTNSP